jgi:TM2 domain-containing membrane protein YozV
MGKPLLLKMFQVLCLIIVGLATIVLLIVIFGYVGILSPEQMESLDKLGTGVLNQKPS